MSRTLKEYAETGEPMDNRDMERKNVTTDLFHPQYGTASCPHCGCTLTDFTVGEYRYCYVCGGGFAEVFRPEEGDTE